MCNKRTVESLIKAGAFDSLGHTRKGLRARAREAIDASSTTKRAEAVGQYDLFGGLDGERDVGPTPGLRAAHPDRRVGQDHAARRYEREMLGLYVSDHPLSGRRARAAGGGRLPIAALHDEDAPTARSSSSPGCVTACNRKVTKQGNVWAHRDAVEDLEASVEVMVFPQTYQLVAPHVVQPTPCSWSRAGSTSREDGAKAHRDGDHRPRPALGERGPVVDHAAGGAVHPAGGRAAQGRARHAIPGVTDVHLPLHNGPRTTVVALDDRLRVTPSPALFGDLKALLGPSCLQ